MHPSYACFQRWHDGSMHKRGTTVLFCVLIKKIFDFLSRMRTSKHFIMLLARAKLRFLREQPDDFFSVGKPCSSHLASVFSLKNICIVYRARHLASKGGASEDYLNPARRGKSKLV